ncbi:hypothetical protein B0H14DRAFT_2605608 [Mycena olivaceomarginata]|nr:hypothetical protein B0H14DRAFT_2605608 [Mycena olivaceomarginata]
MESMTQMPRNYQLEIQVITEVLELSNFCPAASMLEELPARAIALFEHVTNPLIEFGSNSSNAILPKGFGIIQDVWRYQSAIGWVHAIEAQRLSKMSANLYQEARAHWAGVACSIYSGNYRESITQLHRAREVINICGLTGGALSHEITLVQAEIHLLKSEYAQARNIYTQIIKTTSPNQNAFAYALSLLNIAHIDISIGRTIEDVYLSLENARNIFSHQNFQGNIALCDMIEADMQLREKNFDSVGTGFQGCLRSGWGTSHEVESFSLEKLANLEVWEVIEWHFKWPVIYLAYVHKSGNKLALYKALLFVGDVFTANKMKKPQSIYIQWPSRNSHTWMYITGSLAIV